MFRILILAFFSLFIARSSFSQNVISLADWEDNQNSYVGKNVSMVLAYDNSSSGCQLRAVCQKFNGQWKLWKSFRWFGETQGITINVPNKFFENDGALLPNITDGGKMIVTVYVYRGNAHKTNPKEGYTYSESMTGISLELVSIKRAQ